MQRRRFTDRGHRARATVLGAVVVTVTLVGSWVAMHGFLAELQRLERRGTLRTLDALPVLLWAALVLALLWAALLVAVATWSVWRGAGPTGGAPSGQRPGGLVGRLVGILLAITALSSLSAAAPAFAATSSATATRAGAAVTPTVEPHGSTLGRDAKAAAHTADSCAQDVPLPGWVPDKPSRTDQLARECAPLVTGKPVADDSGEVVVHRGDTLWSIAAAHLGPHADAQAIAAEWPRWYAANRQIIGDNPDLLFIGTRLQSPDRVLEGSAR